MISYIVENDNKKYIKWKNYKGKKMFWEGVVLKVCL